jgi:hypothetical protein
MPWRRRELLGEQGTDLVGIRGLQLLEQGEGLAQVGPRLLLAAERPQGHAEGTEAVGLPVGVVQLPADGQALLQAVERVLVAALPLVSDAESGEAGRLTCPVAEVAADGQALPLQASASW